jgi:Ca2+-transporting ATPase
MIRLGAEREPSPGADLTSAQQEAADSDLMRQPPRSPGSGVTSREIWLGIVFAGLIMATGTLLVLDSSLPGGLIAGSGAMLYARTMAFTTLVLFQISNVFNARSDTRSAFAGLFHNHWLWGGVTLSVLLQLAVLYLPFLQRACDTVSLSAGDWLICTLVASSVLWLREVSKLVQRGIHRSSTGKPLRVGTPV